MFRVQGPGFRSLGFWVCLRFEVEGSGFWLALRLAMHLMLERGTPLCQRYM